MRLAKKPGIRGFAKSSHASMFVIGRYEVAPQTQLFGYRQPLGASVKKTTQRTICYLKTENEKRNEQPTHKTAHLQIAQADTRPKFAKELFSCRRTQAHPPPLITR